MACVVGGDVVDVYDAKPVRLIRVADEGPGSIGHEHLVVAGRRAHDCEVGDLVGAAPAAGRRWWICRP